jgi:hypothetical protein
MCPVCAIAAGAGIGIAEELGVDDLVTGLWVGALTVAMIGWTVTWLNKKKIHFKGRIILTTLVWYALMVWPLQGLGFIGHPLNVIWGYDRLLVGIVFGSIVFFATHLWYLSIKKRNGGHAWFPMQKVVWPVSTLLLVSIAFFFLGKQFPPL